MDIIIHNFDKIKNINFNFIINIKWGDMNFNNSYNRNKFFLNNNKGICYKNEVFEGYYSIEAINLNKNTELIIELKLSSTRKIIVNLTNANTKYFIIDSDFIFNIY